nr:HAD-IA family hydrolase [uncultured Lichenicoccus sp.]
MAERRLTSTPLQLVIFDCNGVLIDSEPPSNRLVAAEIRAHGSDLSDAVVQQRFAGKALSMIAAELAATDGIVLPIDWPKQMHHKLIATLEREAVLMPGARAMLEAVLGLGLPIRVASNSSHQEMEVKFRRTYLDALLSGRLHSAHDVDHPKPWPDLFLAAARAETVAPEACLVVEDSETGVAAARAAGMGCLVFCPHGDLAMPALLDDPGHIPHRISHLEEVAPLVMQAPLASDPT